MVLSLAFIISFVISAVALLVGVVMFSEISDGMALTFDSTPEIIIPEVIIPEIIFPESTQNLAQNSASGDEPIANNITNLPSVYSGLNNTHIITQVTIPISSVNASATIDILKEGQNGTSTKSNPQHQVELIDIIGGLTVGDKVTDVNLTYGSRLFGAETGQKVAVALYTNTGSNDSLFATSDIVNLTPLSPQGTCVLASSPCSVDFSFTPPFELTTTSVRVMINAESGSRHIWGGVGTGSHIRQIFEFEENGSCVTFPTNCIPFAQFPPTFVGNGSAPTGGMTVNHLKIETTTAGGALPIQYQVGLFDSLTNALSIQSGSVTSLGEQNLVVSFPNVTVPTNGQVSVGIYGENINYLGDSNIAEFSNDIGSMEDPFVVNGLDTTAQRTIMQVVSPEVIIPEVIIPEIIIPATGGANDQFTSASNIALTVIGVLPVALFFILFTILSGRTGGE